MRRPTSVSLALALAFAPFPSRAQVGRVTLEAPVAPTPSLSGVGAAAAAPASLSPSALTPGLALSPVLAAPAAQPLPQDALLADQVPLQAVAAVKPVAAIVPAGAAVRPASNDGREKHSAVAALKSAAAEAVSDPAAIGKLYDAAPGEPDLEALATVKAPSSPSPWKPRLLLLKPAASVVNAWRAMRDARRAATLRPEKRLTVEELGMRETLSEAVADLRAGRLQDALTRLSSQFQGQFANGWYRSNERYAPYQRQAHAYIRFVEAAVKRAFERAHGRARDAVLIAEARAAERSGSLAGHGFRMTAIQERDSGHCALHALYNAITASVGFAAPVSVDRFVARARERLNVGAESVTGKSGHELAALEHSLGLKFGVDVGEGMSVKAMGAWASFLGMTFESRGPPSDEAGWLALLRSGRETMISLRLFHERFPHTDAERELHGHDYRVLHHEVYLLGSFVSPSRGVRLFMVQDSGSGATDFYTAEELGAVAQNLQLVAAAGPRALP